MATPKIELDTALRASIVIEELREMIDKILLQQRELEQEIINLKRRCKR